MATAPAQSHAARIDALTPKVRHALGDTSVVIRPWREGLDFWADLAETGEFTGVFRSPRSELHETSYDGVVDFGEVVEREVKALRLMSQAGIPVPRVLGWQRGRPADPSWVLLSYVPHEDAPEIPLRQLGELTRRLHDIRPRLPGLEPVSDWPAFIWQRLRQRLAAARAYCELPSDQRLERAVIALLQSRREAATSLLHMDLRAANLCVRDGQIAAIIDVANCVVGDPLLELGRIRCYGLLSNEFLTGYGLDISALQDEERTLLDIYELDTSALLTVVAVEEVGDIGLHREQAARTEQLASGIAERVSAA